ncbi:MAG TPA: HemK2/MTQ2 family protein methyltransferase [Candidatus Nanoarchaeia archaeon]|nr:HemK2/MTQ2 family protein methyltransferase [Candidatus Nanoarchaeia archaeon]
MIEARASIDSAKQVISILKKLKAELKGTYSFHDIIFVPKDSERSLNDGFVRVRVYKTNNWDQKNVVVTQKETIIHQKGKESKILFRKEFDTKEEAFLFVNKKYGLDFQQSMEFDLSGEEYQLGSARLFIDTIQYLGPTVEIVVKDERELPHLLKMIKVKEVFQDCVPEKIRKIKMEELGEAKKHSSIYNPAEDSYLLKGCIEKFAEGRVLDMGTGSGILAFTALDHPYVSEVVAVDINPEAILQLKKEIKEKHLRRITALVSDLFSDVQGKFNVILFNPPYLPQDKGIEDVALYGGKKGWEIAQKFFEHASHHLVQDGKILFLFSSLTGKEKIEDIIKSYLFQFQEIAKEKLPQFEELYVYMVEKSPLLRELEKKNVEQIRYFTHGKRGSIFRGEIDRSKLVKTHFPGKKDIQQVIIKIKREESDAIGRIANEVKWLTALNLYNIGPRLLFSGEGYFVTSFIEGMFIMEWIASHRSAEVKKVLHNVLQQCFVMDTKKVNKEEMHHPLKHIVVDPNNRPILLDFERCAHAEKPHNVTQFIEFICRMKKELEGKGISVPVVELRELSKQYKEEMTKENLNWMIEQIC